MANADVPLTFYLAAGALIASNGFFDCLLFSITRRSLVFASTTDVATGDTGLETFTFARTPIGKPYGNAVWIQGGQRGSGRLTGGLRWPRRKTRYPGMGDGKMSKKPSEQSLRSARDREIAIQMDVVTSVAVESNHEAHMGGDLGSDLRRWSVDTIRASLELHGNLWDEVIPEEV